MTALSIDTPAIAQLLRKRGVTEGALATKADLREVELRLESKIETSTANLKVDILRWLVVTQVALGGVLLAAMKLLR